MPTQTPASRKFAPPPSARSSIAAASSSSRPSFINCLARASQPSSSPSVRKPFKDTIQDEGPAEIDLDEQDDHEFFPQNPRAAPTGHNARSNAINISTAERDQAQEDHVLEHAKSSTKRRKLSHFVSESIVDHDNELSSSPLPPSPSTRQPEHDIHIEVPHTSPLGAIHNDNINITYNNNNNDHDDDDSSDPANYSPNAQEIMTPKKHSRSSNPISRFKTPQYPFPPPSSFSAPLSESSDPPSHRSLPSFQSRLLASSSSTTAASTAGPHLRGAQPSIDFTLPDAFSPSRRRGNREYLHSGHAETVRGWILDLAARTTSSSIIATGENKHSNTISTTSRTSSTSRLPSQKNSTPTNDDRRKIRIEDVVVRDPAGRFLVVKVDAGTGAACLHVQAEEQEQTDTDEEVASRWLLTNVDQHHQQGYGVGVGGGGSKFDRVKPGVTIMVKGGDVASWTLNLGINSSESGASKMRVAVLWDIVR